MNKVLVLGIDGLPYSLANRLIDTGIMPNLKEVVSRGTLAQMHTTVPDFSCVAWTSFATGVNPGKHGIYGFNDFDPVTGQHYAPTASDCRAKSLWHHAGECGARSIILNLPGTYPATPLRGKLVAGFVAPDFNKACYPETFAQTLRSLGYRMDLDGQIGLGGPEHVEKCLMDVLAARRIAFRHAIKFERWDLCVAVITETDRFQHFFLHIMDDENHPKFSWAINFYKTLDDFIGELMELVDGIADVFLVSDHGFQVVKHLIIVEDMLRDLGLAPSMDERPLMPCWKDPEVAKRTKVFCLDPGRFYINRRDGRFPFGCVDETEVDDILDIIEEHLTSLSDPDSRQPIVSTVRRKHAGFWGDELAYAPDLVAATHPGYYFRAFNFPDKPGYKNINWEANHVWNDAIVYCPYKLGINNQPMIWDVLPSALAMMGMGLPDGIDGCDLRLQT